MFSCSSTRVTLNLVFVRYLPHLFRYEEINYHILLLIVLGFRYTSTRIGHRPASSNNSNNEKKYPQINHQFDLWHIAKSLKKRLRAASQTKGCEDLGAWAQSIHNHLWWSAEHCNGSVTELQVFI